MMPAMSMQHEIDPKQEILERVGNLDGIEVFGADILLAVYQRPSKTSSGIILTDRYRDEDKWQGKTHLVLKMGPTAFIDDEGKQFRDIKAGDWVVLRPSDGQLVTLNTLKKSAISKDDTILCRIAQDATIRMRIDHPDQIW